MACFTGDTSGVKERDQRYTRDAPDHSVQHVDRLAGPSACGLLDTEVGVKYRFLDQTKDRPEVGTFPIKDFGPWTTYGGGGYEIVPQDGFKNFPYAGWLLQRDVGEKGTLGGALWYHGPEGMVTPHIHTSTMVDFGGYCYFRKPAFQLSFALGHSIAGQAETYAYLGLSFAGRPSAAAARPYE